MKLIVLFPIVSATFAAGGSALTAFLVGDPGEPYALFSAISLTLFCGALASVPALLIARELTKQIESAAGFCFGTTDEAQGELTLDFFSEMHLLASGINDLANRAVPPGDDGEIPAGIKTNYELLKMENTVKKKAQELLNKRTMQLASLNSQLERSNQELEDFAYIASHDLKEPLRGIHNYSGILLEDYSDKLDAEGVRRLNTLMSLSQRMELLIDSLLEYSRLGRVELAIGKTDLNSVVRDVLDSLQISITNEGVEVLLPHPLPQLECDKVRISELFRNLITNSIKYNDKPKKTVEIGFIQTSNKSLIPESAPDEARAAKHIIYIRDNGIGIQARHRDSIFRIFKRLHGRDKFGGGTGVGLTIVKTIVERHGGRIWLDSEFGVGTTFYFTLGVGN
jgi:signal transduction histidine kinase